MWKGDSDGGELPDRRQVAATQGPVQPLSHVETPPSLPPAFRLPQGRGSAHWPACLLLSPR